MDTIRAQKRDIWMKLSDKDTELTDDEWVEG